MNAVAPGPIWTPLQVTDGQPDEKVDEFGEETPLAAWVSPPSSPPAYVVPRLGRVQSYVIGERSTSTAACPRRKPHLREGRRPDRGGGLRGIRRGRQSVSDFR